MNDLNRLQYTILSDPADAAAVRTALSVPATAAVLALAGGTMTGDITMSGASIFDANASIAAHATTCDPWSLGNYVTLTGAAVTFTAMANAPQAGAEVELYMNAAHVFTDGAVFQVDGNANYTATAGDRVLLRAKSTTVFTVHPRKADGTAVVAPSSGKLIQRGYAAYTAATALTTQMVLDDTIPQNTEGTQILSVALSALSSATNVVRVRFSGMVATVTDANAIAALFWDSVAGALSATCVLGSPAYQGAPIYLEFEHVPGDTAVHTYKINAGPDAAVSLYFNTNNGTRVFGGVSRATLIVEEIEP